MNSKEFKVRASVESDTSGYSSSSMSSRASGSFFNDHSYTNAVFPFMVPLKNQKTINFPTNLKFSTESDHVQSLKDFDEEKSSVIANDNRLNENGSNEKELVKKSCSIKTRRKSMALEQKEQLATAPRRSRRLSTYHEVNSEESSTVKKKEPKELKPKEMLQFPHLSEDFIVELKSSPSTKINPLKIRRKSHSDVYYVVPTECKVIARRKSVYVPRSHETQKSFQTNENKIVKRRKSTLKEFNEEINLPLKKVRRQSMNKKNKVKRAGKSDEPEIEVIEDVWFVSLETFGKESRMSFLVKWDGFPPSENTHEPFEHIRHCEVLQEFVDRKFIQHADQLKKVQSTLLVEIKEKFESYLKRSKTSIVKKLCDFDELHFKCSLLAYIFTYGGEVMPSFMKKLRNECLIYHFYEKWKKEQDSNFMLLETIMSEENYSFALTAENNTDYDPIPKFEYLSKVTYPITSYNFGLNVGCKCGGMCNSKTNCCPQSRGWTFMYTNDEKLKSKDVQMIVECNDFCNCSKYCPNRPKEITVKLVIFKTQNRGWSVKTLDYIPAGKFIVEYTGEFLDKNESKKRARSYSNRGATYLFDLDYIEKGTPYSIDATHKGNIARFINHSCNPNLSTFPAITCNQDPRMHKLYYFSSRFIRAGEELTIDYLGGSTTALTRENDEKFQCHCGSKICRGYIF